ncbi:hypothetical protein K402DRAFT_102137 [Aulographum hederae CBS 113979]|uniref:Uncharacterized protein n=1 Tax=Aulographum hederae CBS 113979 TaxID=1176131 RepID=A0A6G1GYG1_9PEZI|nr:hypothetical protein K402DRAFT_102137 [Aulographum hederae CBS 113979]
MWIREFRLEIRARVPSARHAVEEAQEGTWIDVTFRRWRPLDFHRVARGSPSSLRAVASICDPKSRCLVVAGIDNVPGRRSPLDWPKTALDKTSPARPSVGPSRNYFQKLRRATYKQQCSSSAAATFYGTEHPSPALLSAHGKHSTSIGPVPSILPERLPDAAVAGLEISAQQRPSTPRARHLP